MNIMKNVMKISWNQFETTCERIRAMLDIDVVKVAGIARGGMMVAGVLSYRLNCELSMINWQTRDSTQKPYNAIPIHQLYTSTEGGLLIVDDIIDSGLTLQTLQNTMNAQKAIFFEHQIPVRYAACFVRRSIVDSNMFPDLIYGAIVEDGPWVNFPWDTPHSH
jgi:hypoxanthine phosphoribosyltransferase